MIKRTLLFVNPFHLSLSNKQMVASNREKNITRSVPIEDIGFIVLDNQQITITHALLRELSEANVALIVCNEKHHPVSMMMNLDSHQLQGEIFDLQLKASEPLKKNLWKQTIKAKISNQAALLRKLHRPFDPMLYMVGKVSSGDKGNVEARAARHYWQHVFNDNTFRRLRIGENPNSLLNYAYAILRAGVARALMGSGLLPTLGIHHHNRYNAYRLADDIMEPYRPFADEVVVETYAKFPDYEDLTPQIKSELLNLLTVDVNMGSVKRPLLIALSITSASLAKCFAGERRNIRFPVFE